MNMKRIISTALLVIMLLSSIIAVMPMGVLAAVSSKPEDYAEQTNMSMEEVQKFINETYITYNFTDAQTMLEKEDSEGMLVSVKSEDGKYSIFVNRYTGFVYYVNNVTGQIFTSNPTDPAAIGGTESLRKQMMSQIKLEFSEKTSTTTTTYYSTTWAAYYSQISVANISGGIRVDYILGDTSKRFLLPGRIDAKDFHDYIINPMIEKYNKLFEEAMDSDDLKQGVSGADAFTKLNEKYEELLEKYFNDSLAWGYSYTDKSLYYEYLRSPEVKDTVSEYVFDRDKVEAYLSAATKVYTEKLDPTSDFITDLDTLAGEINALLGVYTLLDKDSNNRYEPNGNANQENLDQLLKSYPICEKTAVYVFKTEYFENNSIANLRMYSGYLTKNCPDYTFEMMYEDERECEFEYAAAQKPVFRCSLEYTFNKDGSLSVRLPANSIVFDETTYTLISISPLPFFGCSDMSQEGYLFYPDGSGSILDFSDFYSDVRKTSVSYTASVYGHDYAYSYITGAHREQVTMPVYGMVSTSNATADTQNLFGISKIKNGCFVMVEEGNAHAALNFESGGVAHKYLWAYTSFAPFPIDKYELSETISVGASNEWNTVVGETKYSGSYVLRIAMLTDDAIGEKLYNGENYYPASYSGMAAYYRDYLKANGTLTGLQNVEKNIPLYIEALGAMTITDKFLTFPVEKSIPLTTFENVETIYKELSQAETQVELFYDQYMKLAEEAENELLKIEYLQKAKKYDDLKGNIENIKNINFRLTGFANGGMNSTYPTKLKWEKACGGKSDFKDLVAFSKTETEKADYNLGIFPDFDFLYINNTASFDGISNKGNVSRMVDNRYASKQVYNSLLGEFESIFAMVISADTLEEHFSTFNEKYSKFEHSQLSVSTLGSDLNSNFDEKNTIDRQSSLYYVTALLEEMTAKNGYELMVDTGNIYSAKYADHILNLSTDFSATRFSSYAVPFLGMILHGHVSYTGTPLNYSGSPAYDLLRAIESGANPYYIVAYQNNAYMKDDPELSDYYGIDYENWYDEILTTYTSMNKVLKDIQDYEIVDHKTLLAERIADKSERLANYNELKAYVLDDLNAQLALAAKIAVNADGAEAKLVVDVDLLYTQIATKILGDYAEEIGDGVQLKNEISLIADKFEAEYNGSSTTPITVDSLVYELEDGTFASYKHYTEYEKYNDYRFTTDSTADAKDYNETVYTLDNDNVVMVTYQKETKDAIYQVSFVLNYNLYDVKVNLGDGNVIPLSMYGYTKITNKISK